MRPLASIASVTTLLSGALCLMPAAASAIPFDVQVYDRTEARYLPTYQFEGRTYAQTKYGSNNIPATLSTFLN